jgi:hypothetical protein
MAKEHRLRARTAAPASAAVDAAEPLEDDTVLSDDWDTEEDAAASDWEAGPEADSGESDEWDEPVGPDEDLDDLEESGELTESLEEAQLDEDAEDAELESEGSDWVEGAKSILDGLDRILKK